ACVDPLGECESGDMNRCLESPAPHYCVYDFPNQHSPFCSGGEWVCAPGRILESECRCWGEAPAEHECTEKGWTPIEDGAAP
ncbi:MAG TPA: hypothetical protein VGK73_23085, partial [Polyangiaceae bacterium]